MEERTTYITHRIREEIGIASDVDRRDVKIRLANSLCTTEPTPTQITISIDSFIDMIAPMLREYGYMICRTEEVV